MPRNYNADNNAGLGSAIIAGNSPTGYNEISVNVDGSIPAENDNQFLARNNQVFAATTGDRLPTAGAAHVLSIYNPSGSGKTLVVFKCGGYYTTAASHPVFYLATVAGTNPQTGWTTPTQITPTNMLVGGIASVSSVYTTGLAQTGIALPATGLIAVMDTAANTNSILIGSGVGDVVVLPPNTGFIVAVNWTSTEHFSINAMWSEL